MPDHPPAPISEDAIWDAYNLLLLGPDTERLRKLMVRCDLLRKTVDLPGDVVECGVFKGTGLLTWLKLLSIYAPGSHKRVVGFDTFGGFAPTTAAHDTAAADAFVAQCGVDGTTVETIERRVLEAGFDADQVELVPGDVSVTCGAYARDRPGLRISLLHMDLDLGEPTYAALVALWPRVVPGGVVVFDEYAVPRWSESDGVDRFVATTGLRLRAVPHGRTPTAYLVKP